jgi:hypothetical protein
MTRTKTTLGLIAVVVLLAMAGCGSKQDDWLTVTDDPAAIGEARELGDHVQNQEMDRLLANLDDSLLDTDAFAVLKGKTGGRLVQLRKIASGDPVTDKTVGATVVLCTLKDTAGLAQVRRILTDGRKGQRKRLLDMMNFASEAVENVSADESLRTLLLGQLDDADREVVREAVQVCGRYNVPGAATKLSAILPSSTGPATERVCYWLSRLDPQPAHVEALLKLMEVDDGTDAKAWGTRSLLHFAKCDHPATSERAAEVLRDQRKSATWNTVDQYLRQQITEALIEVATADDIPWLNSLLASDTRDYLKCRVMLALDRLDGGRAKRLPVALKDPELRSYAAEALAEVSKDTQDDRAVNQLKDAAVGEERPAVLAAIAGALLDVGGDEARSAATGLVDRLEPAARTTILWRANGWNAVSVMDQVVAAGLLDESAYCQALEDLEVDENDAEEADGSLLAVMWEADILLAFDVETGMLPCRHDQLLRDFANSSRGIFTPESVSQQWHQQNPEDFEADYTLQFVFDGRLYRVRIRNQGDWYDVERLVLAINRALRDAGHPERFYALAVGGQVAQFVFATPVAAETLSTELHLPIDEKLDRAMREGKEFEERVLEKYRSQGEEVTIE